MAKSKHAVNGRDSGGHSFGLKAYGGELVSSGSIIVRQRGTTMFPGKNTGLGSNYTIFAKVTGKVHFRRGKNDRVTVSIIPDVHR